MHLALRIQLLVFNINQSHEEGIRCSHFLTQLDTVSSWVITWFLLIKTDWYHHTDGRAGVVWSEGDPTCVWVTDTPSAINRRVFPPCTAIQRGQAETCRKLCVCVCGWSKSIPSHHNSGRKVKKCFQLQAEQREELLSVSTVLRITTQSYAPAATCSKYTSY